MSKRPLDQARGKVFVGMSGGVDSSVSAALLQKAGFSVTGVFIKVWHPDWLPCEWQEERRDAMRVAVKLGIPFLTFEFQDEYKKSVVDYMLYEYKEGRTPNPDVMCNKEIKFGSFLRKAKKMGADYIATGHYARIDNKKLLEGADKNKDQSYFLWTLGQEELDHVLFPVGGFEKKEVRKLANKFGLPTAEKKDSQGICFIGKVDMKEFLQHYIPSAPGDVLNEVGETVGRHEGVIFYTIGERHGFDITKRTPHDEPMYIVAKNLGNNTITVSANLGRDADSYSARKVRLGNVNWISGQAPDPAKTYGARIRYHQEKQKCAISGSIIAFEPPQKNLSIGQSLVLYDGEVCLGGGIMEEIL